MFILAFSATALELQPGIQHFTLEQLGNVSEITITNSSGANAPIILYDAPSTNITRVHTYRTNVHRVIGQPLNNQVTTNISYKVLATFSVSNGHYRAIYPTRAVVYGLAVSNTATVSVGIKQ